MDFQTIHIALGSWMEGRVQDLLLQEGWMIKIVSDQIVEWSARARPGGPGARSRAPGGV